MGKRVYLTVYGVTLGAVLALDVCAYVANIILEKRAANRVETITAPPLRVSANDTLYASVRKYIAQNDSTLTAVANELPDALLEQAIISLGKGKHSIPEIALRTDELMLHKVPFPPPSLEMQQQKTGLPKGFKILLTLLISLVAIVLMGLVVQLAHWGVDFILDYLKYNAAKVGREPQLLKWFLAIRDNIKAFYTYGFFFGSIVMFWGVVFKAFE